jgi:hypothetical protein
MEMFFDGYGVNALGAGSQAGMKIMELWKPLRSH